MPLTISKKLRIREEDVLLMLNAPTYFKRSVGELPGGVKIISAGKNYDQVHWFVMNKAEMEREMNKVLNLIKENVIVWIYYPKGSSKLQTDLTRDKGWENLLKHGDKLTWISLISFDDNWSAFGCRLITTADKKKEQQRPARPIFDYVHPSTKAVRLPDDLEIAFKKNKKEAASFHALSFTNKKEYIEWIITAKQEETRKNRITGTIEKLAKGCKNPADKQV